MTTKQALSMLLDIGFGRSRLRSVAQFEKQDSSTLKLRLTEALAMKAIMPHGAFSYTRKISHLINYKCLPLLLWISHIWCSFLKKGVALFQLEILLHSFRPRMLTLLFLKSQSTWTGNIMVKGGQINSTMLLVWFTPTIWNISRERRMELYRLFSWSISIT